MNVLTWCLFICSLLVTVECGLLFSLKFLLGTAFTPGVLSSIIWKGKCADSWGDEYALGIESPTHFDELISVCFNPLSEIAFYSTHIVHANYDPKHCKRTDFRKGGVKYSVDIGNIYRKQSQAELFKNRYGEDVINTANYFARGHLAPCADFHTKMEKDETMYYINAVPQWQKFNNGNWKKLEDNVRTLAEKYGSLNIWTGIHDVMIRENVENKNRIEDVSLGRTEGKNVIPVPKYIWKVIYERKADKGVAVISFNDPDSMSSIPNTCAYITWISFNVTDVENGTIQCLTVQQLFKETGGISPDLPTAGVLTN